MAGVPEVQQADDLLVWFDPQHGAHGWRLEQWQCAPVAGEPAGVGAEQNDVGGNRRGEQVLVLLGLVAGQCGARDD